MEQNAAYWDNVNTTDNFDTAPVKHYITSIEEGDWFKCIKTVVMEGSRQVAYTEGKLYRSDENGCITNDWGQESHYWSNTDELNRHFIISDYSDSRGVNPNNTNSYRQFETGAIRDNNSNKPFIHCLLGYTRQRFGYHMAKNASKYGEFNFLKGIPTEAYLESLDRHLAAYMEGDRTEDHLSAILFGVQGIMLNEKNEGVQANSYFTK